MNAKVPKKITESHPSVINRRIDAKLVMLASEIPETYTIHYLEDGERKTITIRTSSLVVTFGEGEKNAENFGQSDDHGSG